MTTRGSQLEVRARSVGRQHRMGGSRPPHAALPARSTLSPSLAVAGQLPVQHPAQRRFIRRLLRNGRHKFPRAVPRQMHAVCGRGVRVVRATKLTHRQRRRVPLRWRSLHLFNACASDCFDALSTTVVCNRSSERSLPPTRTQILHLCITLFAHAAAGRSHRYIPLHTVTQRYTPLHICARGHRPVTTLAAPSLSPQLYNRPACRSTASEATLSWFKRQSAWPDYQYTGQVVGYGVDTSGTQRMFNAFTAENWNAGLIEFRPTVLSPAECQYYCGDTYPEALFFNYYYSWAGSTYTACACFRANVNIDWPFAALSNAPAGSNVVAGSVCSAVASCGASSTWTSSQVSA